MNLWKKGTKMKAHSSATFLVLILAAANLSAAAGDWLWNFPLNEEHRRYRQFLGEIAPQPLFYADSTDYAGTNVLEAYRCLTFSSWGFDSVTFSFTRVSSGESTNKTAVVCHFESKELQTNDIIVFRHQLSREASESLLQMLSEHEIYSRPNSLTFKTPDRMNVYTVDASDIIIERWGRTSYSCIMRPGIHAHKHEESVNRFVQFCFKMKDKIKSENRKPR